MTLDDKLRETLTKYRNLLLEPEEHYVEDKLTQAKAIAQIHQAFAEEGYTTADQLAKNLSSKINIMTGQEWYDRFEKELEPIRRTMPRTIFKVKEAARKAAGIE